MNCLYLHSHVDCSSFAGLFFFVYFNKNQSHCPLDEIFQWGKCLKLSLISHYFYYLVVDALNIANYPKVKILCIVISLRRLIRIQPCTIFCCGWKWDRIPGFSVGFSFLVLVARESLRWKLGWRNGLVVCFYYIRVRM